MTARPRARRAAVRASCWPRWSPCSRCRSPGAGAGEGAAGPAARRSARSRPPSAPPRPALADRARRHDAGLRPQRRGPLAAGGPARGRRLRAARPAPHRPRHVVRRLGPRPRLRRPPGRRRRRARRARPRSPGSRGTPRRRAPTSRATACGASSPGDFDAYIARWARQVAAYGGPVRLRFAQEMNGRWFPWAERANGNRRGEFVRAWRHVHAIFARAGAPQRPLGVVPRGRVDPALAVPGPHAGRRPRAGRVQRRHGRLPAPVAVVPRGLRPVAGLPPRRSARRKPIELSEVGSTEQGGSKAAWIHGMFRELRRRPEVRSVVWFNVRKEADWRIESSRSAQRAFAAEGIRAATRRGPGRRRTPASGCSRRASGRTGSRSRRRSRRRAGRTSGSR